MQTRVKLVISALKVSTARPLELVTLHTLGLVVCVQLDIIVLLDRSMPKSVQSELFPTKQATPMNPVALTVLMATTVGLQVSLKSLTSAMLATFAGRSLLCPTLVLWKMAAVHAHQATTVRKEARRR
jgi:hypothetical protein